ncbi:MAG: phage major capsid protein [Clostridia bacterium]|nr:phage major capsid protein [Clostridia bacterium]
MANFETIKLDKGLYHTSKGFLQELESIDPSEDYKGTSLEGLDAFERQLKRFDIKVKGANSDTIDKFFATTDSSTLFPEYVSRAVRQGAEEASTLDSLVATKTNINSYDYRSLVSNMSDDAKKLVEVEEGAQIPETTISVQDNLIRLKKYGRMLSASYEALRFQKIDLFTITLRQIGAYIARTQFDDAVNTLILGDGNIESLEPISPVDGANGLCYADLVNLWHKLSPYEMNAIVVNKTLASKILLMPELRDANAGLNFHGTGKMLTPLGAKLIVSNVLGNDVIGADKNYALEFITAGGIQTEFDKLIDRQLERVAITQISGFSRIFNDAATCVSFV